MWREVRRKDREMDEQSTLELLSRGEYGVMATVDGEGCPYATPLSYVYLDGAVYFHCAGEGQKLDNIAQNPRVSFAVVGATEPVFQNNFTTRYESLVLFGEARPVEGREERVRALLALCEKYLPAHMDRAEEYINQSYERTTVIRISLDRISGKKKA